jgi:hypothetical protein
LSEAANASRQASCTADGSWAIAFGLPASGGVVPAGNSEARLVASLLAKIAPKIETPIDPPTWRNSDETEVATPSCS